MALRTDRIFAATAACLGLICAAAAPGQAQQFVNAQPQPFSFPLFEDGGWARPQPPTMIPDQRMIVPEDRPVLPQDRAIPPQDDTAGDAVVPAHLRRQLVNYPTPEAPGTIVVDTPNTYLYFVLGGGRAIRYGVGVGREGFTWSGVRSIGRKDEWPDWHPPAEMIARQPYLPRFMSGGPGNPLGARAMYLQGTLYRIHGTNQPETIGKQVSSGCIRMLNEDAIDLYNRVSIGTKVVVLPDTARSVRNDQAPTPLSPRRNAVSAVPAEPLPLAAGDAPNVAPALPPRPSLGLSASRIY